jgi:hypothetical protein
MPSSYPSSSDTFTVPSGSATLGGSTPTHTDAHQQMADAIRRVQDTIVLSGLAVGALLYGASGTQVTTLAAGAAGRFLQANGAAAPAWFDLFGAANAWTASQTIDRGTGTLPALLTASNNLRISNGSALPPDVETLAYGTAISGLNLRCRTSGGTRAAPAAIAVGTPFFNLLAYGADETGLITSARGRLQMFAAEAWSSGAHGTGFRIYGTSTGTTTETEWVRWHNGSQILGATSLIGSERLRVTGGSIAAPGSNDVVIGGGALAVGATTGSTSTTTGALTVAGGVGVAKRLYVGGLIISSSVDIGNQSFVAAGTGTLVSNSPDQFLNGLAMTPTYSGPYTLDRHNYISLSQVASTGGAVVTDACVFQFTAAAGVHKAVASGTTKATPGAVDAWVKININGELFYIAAYRSRTT